MIEEASLVAAAQTQHQVEGRLLLDVVVRERASILELLAREDETLLVGRDALLVLDLRLDVLNRVGGLHLEGDGLASEGFHEDLWWGVERSVSPEAQRRLHARAGRLVEAGVLRGPASPQAARAPRPRPHCRRGHLHDV